jgi:hypothetical protein
MTSTRAEPTGSTLLPLLDNVELDGQLNTRCESKEGLRIDGFRFKTANTSIP